jgi:hypothetical protein
MAENPDVVVPTCCPIVLVFRGIGATGQTELYNKTLLEKNQGLVM